MPSNFRAAPARTSIVEEEEGIFVVLFKTWALVDAAIRDGDRCDENRRPYQRRSSRARIHRACMPKWHNRTDECVGKVAEVAITRENRQVDRDAKYLLYVGHEFHTICEVRRALKVARWAIEVAA